MNLPFKNEMILYCGLILICVFLGEWSFRSNVSFQRLLQVVRKEEREEIDRQALFSPLLSGMYHFSPLLLLHY